MLTGLELTLMGVTWSNSGLFITPGFLFSPVGKNRKGDKRKKRREGGKKGIERERKEGRKNKKDQRQIKMNFNKN